MKILILEYDPILTDVLDDVLGSAFTLAFDYSPDGVIKKMEKGNYDLFLFDLDMPNRDSFKILNMLRSSNDTTPAIVITACGDITEMKKHFNTNLIDFIKKPFELKQLEKAIEIKSVGIKAPKVDKGADDADKPSEVSVQDNELDEEMVSKLQGRRREILNYLHAHHGKVIPYDELMKKFWKSSESPNEAKLRAQIKKIRDAIGQEKISTIRGKGYRYE